MTYTLDPGLMREARKARRKLRDLFTNCVAFTTNPNPLFVDVVNVCWSEDAL